jgi:hypothetical protein
MQETNEDSPAARLKMARERAGFRKAVHAAEHLGVPVPTYQGHENGNREFGREQCLQYASALSVNPGWLMFGPEGGTAPDPAAPPQARRTTGDEVDLLNISVQGQGTLRVARSRQMSDDQAKELLKMLLPTLLPSHPS